LIAVMLKIILPKAKYSEKVVRKTLYWCSEFCQWELQETNDDWVIQIEGAGPENHATKFHRILNDFILREELDRSTKNLRIQIVTAAMEGIRDNGFKT
jgi:His-Xaa-Ser system protein HxsD